MNFNEYVNQHVFCSQLVESVEDTSLVTLVEELEICEAELNEFLGLGKAAEKLKSLNKTADEKLEKAKEKVKDVADTAKYAASNMAREAKDKIVGDAKAVGQAHKEIAVAAKEKLMTLFSKSQSVFKEIWGNVSKKNLSPEQQQVLMDLASANEKMSTGKFLNAEDSIKVLAAILAGKGQVPSAKAYTAQLEKLRSIPGMASVRVSARVGK